MQHPGEGWEAKTQKAVAMATKKKLLVKGDYKYRNASGGRSLCICDRGFDKDLVKMGGI